MKSDRIANIGAVSALLVLFIHLEQVPSAVGSVPWAVYSFVRYVLAVAAVPFFFLVSGYFLAGRIGESGWWRTAVTKRLRTLGVPFLVWSAVPLLVFSVFWTSCDSTGLCPRIAFRFSSVAAAFGCHLLTLPEANRPLWYVRALFFLVLVSPLLVALLRRGGRVALLALLAAYWALNPWSLDAPDWWIGMTGRTFVTFVFSVEGLFYFALGLYLRRHPVALGRPQARALGLVGLSIGLVGLVMQAHGVPDYGYTKLLAIPFVLCLFWGVVPDVRGPAWLVGNTFAVYVIHPMLIRALNAAGVLPPGRWTFVLEWTAVSAVSIGLVQLMRRFLPRVTSLAFGGRRTAGKDP